MGTLAHIRNFGVMAHVDAGKTTVSERMLLLAGRIHRVGEVHDGQAALDHDRQERDRGITISAAATTIGWHDHRLNLVDTPGHIDFGAEVERSLAMMDGAVAVFDAVAGVEPQSETVWLQADRYRTPRLVFINKMDRPGADLDRCVAEIGEVLGATPVVTQLPLFDGERLIGLVDVIAGTRWTWSSDDPRSATADPVADRAMADAVNQARNALIEQVGLLDDEVFDALVAGEVELEQLRAAIRRLTVDGAIVPVLCGSALRGIGIQLLLDAVVAWLPSPLDRPVVTGRRPAPATETVEVPVDDRAPLVALASKVVHGTNGKLTWIRVFTGSMTGGDVVLDVTTGRRERVGRLVQLHAGTTRSVDRLGPGEVGAVIGFRDTATGHTLCDPANPVVIGTMAFPEPVVTMAIEPTRTADHDRLAEALRRLGDEDPTFRVSVDAETGQTLIAGMGELHLQVLVTRLVEDQGVAVTAGRPAVAHRETISGSIRGHTHRLKKQTGGPGLFAEVTIDVEPTPTTDLGSLDFVDATRGGSIPAAFVAAVEAGARRASAAGPGGHPLVGVRLTLTDGAVHPNDSSERAFEIAGGSALAEATALAGLVRLEPVMEVTVQTPDDHVGSVIGLVGARSGEVIGIDDSGIRTVVTARVSLAQLFGFSDAIRSVSQGRALASMAPAGYEPG